MSLPLPAIKEPHCMRLFFISPFKEQADALSFLRCIENGGLRAGMRHAAKCNA